MLERMKSGQTFHWKGLVRFHQADPAGWMFYGSAFQLVHDCFEDFISHLDIPRAEWFSNPQWAVPVRATKADYRAPLRVGDHFEIDLHLSNLGESSLTVNFELKKGETSCLSVETTHVFMDTKTQRKCAIPPDFRRRLEAYHTK